MERYVGRNLQYGISITILNKLWYILTVIQCTALVIRHW